MTSLHPSSLTTASTRPPLRVLYLTPAFPKPSYPQFAPWALAQAASLHKHGIELLVVSFTFLVPSFLGRFGVRRSAMGCPKEHNWSGVRALYPRWLYLNLGRASGFSFQYPQPFATTGWLSARGTLARIAREFKPDIIHAHQTTPCGYVAAKFRDARGVPFVLTEHGTAEMMPHFRDHPRQRAIGKFVNSGASRWISLSSGMRDLTLQAFPDARVAVVPNGSNPAPEELLNSSRRNRPDGKTVLFCAAHFYPVKNLPSMIRAFARVADRHPTAFVRIAGDGEERAKIEHEIQVAKLQDRVTLLGMIPHAEILREMCNADVFILPSTRDSYPTVCLEAAACGLAQIWPQQSGVSDRLRNEIHGYGVDTYREEAIAEAIDKMLADPRRRVTMSEANRELFDRELSWDSQTPRLIEVYREVVEEHRRGS
jgi:glycosyltransferase involved in cell wall biosynthesis